jgi:hypothetical protein
MIALIVGLAACARAASAQRPTDPRIDSLLAEIRVLKARLDSLQRRDTATGALAQLRARAQAAAQRGGQPDTTQARPGAGAGGRNLNQLNPEISVTGDFRGAIQTDGPQRESAELHEMEFSFQSALDPYSHTKLFAGLHEGEIEMEEAYFYYTGLPLRLDVGVFRQQLGELNRWHLHAVPEVDYPLALTTYTGDEGLAGAGLSAYWHTALWGTQEVWAQMTVGANDGLFEGGDRPSYLVHVNNFWQLTRATYMQVGATGVYGTNPDSNLKTRLGGVDVRFTWRPPARAKYREWNVRGELFAIEKERAGTGDVRYGWYVGSTYKLGPRWIAGVRYDYVEAPEGPLAIVRQVIPSLTFWQSEWVRLHGELRHRRQAGATDNLIVLQAVWSIGPHKHETY